MRSLACACVRIYPYGHVPCVRKLPGWHTLRSPSVCLVDSDSDSCACAVWWGHVLPCMLRCWFTSPPPHDAADCLWSVGFWGDILFLCQDVHVLCMYVCMYVCICMCYKIASCAASAAVTSHARRLHRHCKYMHIHISACIPEGYEVTSCAQHLQQPPLTQERGARWHNQSRPILHAHACRITHSFTYSCEKSIHSSTCQKHAKSMVIVALKKTNAYSCF